MCTLEDLITYFVNHPALSYNSCSNHSEWNTLREIILTAFNEGETPNRLKDRITSALELREGKAIDKNKVKIEIDKYVDYIYPFLDFLKAKNLLK